MKEGLKEIVGKRIAGVVLAESDHDPSQQVFLVFSDGTTFEFHGRQFTCCAGLDQAAALAGYIQSGGAQVKRIYPAARATVCAGNEAGPATPADEPLENLLKRDLDAWQAAKAWIESARRR